LACVELAKSVRSITGLKALVIGRSMVVGKPLAYLLIAENATVTVAHSKTIDLPALARQADLLFAAAGQRELVRNDWIKPGATVIDVGIHRVVMRGKQSIVGDVAFDVRNVAGAITPVKPPVGFQVSQSWF
jgi:methylenetetrahydrofolate dehydrogenase (NADP+) / methenyltetrahydrofolate cyclohydrolase